MSYKRTTNFYRIPYMGSGDRMTEQNNQQQWLILDNLLYASNFGCDKCFLQDGDYQLQKENNNYQLKIRPLHSDGFALLGILNYRLFYSKHVLTVNNLIANNRYYIYLEAGELLDTNPESFYIHAYTVKQMITPYNLLLCIVETTSESLIITDVNKVFAKNLLAHTKDNTNPHGKQMYQYDLNVVNSLTLNNTPVYPSIYTSYITQNGEYILSFPDNKQVVFVNAYPEQIKAGYISWRLQDKKIILTNSGQSGIKVNLKIEMR